MLYSRPDLLHRILEVNTDAVTDYLNAQIEAGAQAVMIFDTWGGALTPHAFREFSLRLHGAHRRWPDQGTRRPPRAPASSSPRAAATGWKRSPPSAPTRSGWTGPSTSARRAAAVGDKVALQGNLDPCALHGTPDSIRTEAARIIDSYGNHPGHVFNLGHGISQFTNPDNVSVLVEAVHSRSRALRAA